MYTESNKTTKADDMHYIFSDASRFDNNNRTLGRRLWNQIQTKPVSCTVEYYPVV